MAALAMCMCCRALAQVTDAGGGARPLGRRALQAPCPCGSTYTIQAGDTVQAIAQACGTTTDELAAANSIADVNFVPEGGVLTIPSCGEASTDTKPPESLEVSPNTEQSQDSAAGTSRCPCGPAYTVKAGDGLAAIAQACGTTTDDLAAQNCISDANAIQVDAILAIPGCFRDSAAPDGQTTNSPEAGLPALGEILNDGSPETSIELQQEEISRLGLNAGTCGGQLCTMVRVSERKVPIGKLKPADIVAKVEEACTEAGCASAEIDIATDVWQKGHTPGSTYHRKCDLAADSGNAYACGYWAPGKCTVQFSGVYTQKARDAILPLLKAAADLNTTQANDWPPPWRAYWYSLSTCTWWFLNLDKKLGNACEFNRIDRSGTWAEDAGVLAMPASLQISRFLPPGDDGDAKLSGFINMEVSCDADPETESWKCNHVDFAGAVLSAVPFVAQVLGAVNAYCDKM